MTAALEGGERSAARPGRTLPPGNKKNIVDVASKQQTTALFCPPQLHAQEDTQNWPKKKKTKLTNLMGNLCCAREYSVHFFVRFFYTVKPHGLT